MYKNNKNRVEIIAELQNAIKFDVDDLVIYVKYNSNDKKVMKIDYINIKKENDNKIEITYALKAKQLDEGSCNNVSANELIEYSKELEKTINAYNNIEQS